MQLTRQNTQHNVKAKLYILALVAAVLSMSSCDKKDCNGDLDGMWQLTEWRDKATDHIVKTNQDSLYYCFQQKLVKFQHGSLSEHYLSRFEHTSDELVIGQTTAWPADEVRPLTELAPFGVPADGRLHVERLSNSHMVLSTAASTLTFRKY